MTILFDAHTVLHQRLNRVGGGQFCIWGCEKIYCPLLQTTLLFAIPPKAVAKPLALRGQYERRLLVAKPPPAMDCQYCKIVDFAIEPGINDTVDTRIVSKNRGLRQIFAVAKR